MKMYITKEPYEMLYGQKTHLWRWWIKDKDGNIEKFLPQVQHKTLVKEARDEFVDKNPDGKVFFKDMTK